MVHNGIEYGMMAAFAEGLNILHNADVGIMAAEHSAEVAPMEEPEYYQFDIDTAKVTELWRARLGGLVLAARPDRGRAAGEPQIDGLAGRVSDSGEGRWTVKAAVDIGVPVPVLAASLFERFASRDEDKFANQVLSAMRQQFGGHKELPAGSELEAGAEKADKVQATPGTNVSASQCERSCARSRAQIATRSPARGARCSSTTSSWPISGRTPASTSLSGAGVSGLHRSQRAGQDQPGRGRRAYLSTLSSHRVAADQPLVRAGAERAIVRARVTAGLDDPRQLQLEVEITPARPTGPGSTGPR